MKILLVEDDRYLQEAIVEILKKNKIAVDTTRDGQEGFELASSGLYDVILLDIMLPKLNGLEILSRLRQENNTTPVLLLTAKSSLEDKVVGFNKGADDYLTKPFESIELVMRIRALARRSNTSYSPDVLTFTNISLDPQSLTLSNGHQHFVLTLKESQVLEILIKNHSNVISKSQIIEKIWGYDSDAEDNYVETYISFLRRKLMNLNAQCSIVTLRNLGYVLKEKEKDYV